MTPLIPPITKLTSVDRLIDLNQQYEALAKPRRFTQTKLLNRAMYLYVTDEEFRNKLENTIDLVRSGSQF